ncbi:hypothetical protein AN1V17_42000 [Vallitalea sediminicola]
MKRYLSKYIQVSMLFIVLLALPFLTYITSHFLYFGVYGLVSLISLILIIVVIVPRVINVLKEYISNVHLIYSLIIIVGILSITVGNILFNDF